MNTSGSSSGWSYSATSLPPQHIGPSNNSESAQSQPPFPNAVLEDPLRASRASLPSSSHINLNPAILQIADHDTLLRYNNPTYAKLLQMYNELSNKHSMLCEAYMTLAKGVQR
ncbi:hypothetical protein MVEN_00051500 [Mycena venus]|uniref:Uncharacterized protein n=1 Tax=Mycena venus TaxID=2733690 RepID=A0A8H7DHV1_9AGAR|nr:hypothetical protein MVEN_00051500 [Mycena venus]